MAYTQKSAQPKPPLKGAFPLDHDAECKPFQQRYMQCLADNEYVATMCREASQQYLECRMQKELMHREDVSKLGFDAAASERVEEFNRRLATGDLKVKAPGKA